MPRPRNKITKECQTEEAPSDKQWIEDQIQKGILTFADKFTKHYDDHIMKLQKEIQDLKSTVSLLVSGTDALNNLQQRAEVDIEQLQEAMESIEDNQDQTLARFNRQFEENNETLKSVQGIVDDLEQESKASNIRIFGMDEEEEEDVASKVIDLVRNQLHIADIKTEDIKDTGRMGKRTNKIRDILVQFRSNTLRDKVYNKRRLLKQNDNPVFINEDLTPQRSKLFFEARKLRKREKIFGTWTQKGNVMIKIKDSDQPCAVKSYNELTKLIQCDKQPEVE